MGFMDKMKEAQEKSKAREAQKQEHVAGRLLDRADSMRISLNRSLGIAKMHLSPITSRDKREERLLSGIYLELCAIRDVLSDRETTIEDVEATD